MKCTDHLAGFFELQGVSEAVLQTSIDFACGVGGVDCTPINVNGTCFLPDTRYSHASWAINAFYVNSTDGIAACNFQGAARITTSDPSKYRRAPATHPSGKLPFE